MVVVGPAELCLGHPFFFFIDDSGWDLTRPASS
jgi:hypothetical protein